MGEFFKEKNSGVILAEMSSLRSSVFAEITNLAMSEYKMVGLPIYYQDSCYIIDTVLFQLVTEKVFLRPLDLLYPWSLYATGIYEISKGERYVWLWGGGIGGTNRQNDLIKIEPIIYAHDGKLDFTGITIAPQWYLTPGDHE